MKRRLFMPRCSKCGKVQNSQTVCGKCGGRMLQANSGRRSPSERENDLRRQLKKRSKNAEEKAVANS